MTHHRTDASTPVTIVSLARLPREEALLLTGRLRSEGIEAHVYPPDQANIYGTSLHSLVDVMVPAESLDEARGVVASLGTG